MINRIGFKGSSKKLIETAMLMDVKRFDVTPVKSPALLLGSDLLTLAQASNIGTKCDPDVLREVESMLLR